MQISVRAIPIISLNSTDVNRFDLTIPLIYTYKFARLSCLDASERPDSSVGRAAD